MSFRNAQAAYPPANAPPYYSFAPANGNRPPLHHSVTGQKAATRCVNDVTMMLDSLASAFDQELKEKERDITQGQALLTNIQTEILDSQRLLFGSDRRRCEFDTEIVKILGLHGLRVLRQFFGSIYTTAAFSP